MSVADLSVILTVKQWYNNNLYKVFHLVLYSMLVLICILFAYYLSFLWLVFEI